MDKVYQCLMDNWTVDAKTKPKNIASAIQESNAFEFMILWSMLETKLFHKFCKKKDLLEFSQRSMIPIDQIADITAYFHDRYKRIDGIHNDDYRHLIQSDRVPVIDKYLEKPYDELTDKEKCHLILYVIFRYRNNIFHGNKRVYSWLTYKDQINKCVDAMIFFVQNYSDGCVIE